MTNPDHALSTAAQVEALADQLSACADQLHARLEVEAAAIAGLPDSAARTGRHAALASLSEAEQQLRQRANSLYLDAATAIVAGLGQSQRDVIALTGEAAEKIHRITLLGDAAGLVAGLLALAGGVASGHPAAVVAALKTVRGQIAAVRTDLPRKPG
jgi:hypothetical protein